MNIHIVGSNGYIANRLIAGLEEKPDLFGSLKKYTSANCEGCIYLDLSDFDSIVRMEIETNDYVILLAAISSPDICESEYELAYLVNVAGTSRLIDKALLAGARVLFFSSDTVLGPVYAPTYEDAVPNPFGTYAKMKYEIEERYKGSPNFKVFRLSYVFSNADKFTSYISQCAKAKKPADVYSTLCRNVVYIEDVIDAIMELTDRYDEFDTNLFHVVGHDLLSRMEMASILKENVWKLLELNCVSTPPELLNRRPDIINAASFYIERLLGRKPTPFKDAAKLEFGRD